MTDTVLTGSSPGGLSRLTIRLLAAASRLQRRAATLPSRLSHLFPSVARFARATRLFGIGSVCRAFLASPLFRVRQLVGVARAVLPGLRMPALSAAGVLLGLLARTAARGGAVQWLVNGASAATSRLQAGSTVVVRTVRRAGREVLLRLITSRPATKLLKVRTASAGKGPRVAVLVLALAGMGCTAFVPSMAAVFLVTAATAGLVSLWRSGRVTQNGQAPDGTSLTGGDELSKEELASVYEAMLTVEDALPKAAALLQFAVDGNQTASVNYAANLIGDCQATLEHLTQLRGELNTSDDGSLDSAASQELPADIDGLLADCSRYSPNACDCRRPHR